MIENRNTVLENFEPLQASGAEARWAEPDLSANHAEVRSKRILLVEDEQPLRACLRMMLELEGHQVTEASNGAEALSLFTIGEFDVVVTDFEMPLMKGNKLAVGIKLLAPSLPILMITASASARRDAENPVDALLNKPFTVAELHGALAELLSAPPEPAYPNVVSTLESPSVTAAALA
ncbi:MAG TPA: response regulator [Candidatus Limnocylindrales bacterium]|jgi:CheY-like chemotaxis protein|nr:response regulator [Candidatus Limnocylindrales bacterium]